MAALPWWQRRELFILGFTLLLVLAGLYAWPERSAIIQDLVFPLVSVLSQGEEWAMGGIHDLIRRREILRENKLLRQRIQLLETERLDYLAVLAENRHLQRLIHMKTPPGYITVAARVIGHGADNWRRSILVDQGDAAGVQKNTVAVQADGVVGRVVRVTRWTSQIMLVADANSAVSCLNERTRAYGVVVGQNRQPALLTYPSTAVQFEVGDRLITSGMGGIFPKGLPIGTVTQVQQDRRETGRRIEVTFAVDLAPLEEVVLLVRT